MMKVNIKILLLLGCFCGYLVAEDVLIELPDGKVKGHTELTLTNTTFYSFTGIPYAQPPVGNLRFQAPQPFQPWDGVLDATFERNICYQVSLDADNESEDCLIINVYTPKDPASKSSLPVMFFIYGGGFVSGSSERYGYGPEHFMDYDVIIVTFNYRVGPFGFFSTGDSAIPGNAGLKDQNLALQWVQKNIEYFGGDPDKVTIFGESAGAASVAYQILSPKSKGLFRAAILESGSALSPWAYQRNQVEYTFGTAGYIDPSLNNGSTTSSQLLEYLTNIPASAIDQASANFSTALETPENLQIQQGFYYAPVVEHDHEDAFITEKMYESLQNGEFNKVPVIIGVNSEESLWWFGELMQSIVKEFDTKLSLLLPLDMNVEDNKIEEAGEAIKKLYSPGTEFEDEDPIILYKYFSDQSFIRSIIKHAEFQSKFADVYFYQFSYGGELGCNLDDSVDGFYESVRHGEELYYLFARYCYRTHLYSKDLSIFPEEDVLVLKKFLTMFTNFAKTLNPTPEKSELLENVIWPKFNDGDLSYLDIGSTSVVKQHPRNSTYDAWNALYEKYGVPPYDTY